MEYREGIDFLRCPACDADVIPYAWIEHGEPMWREDMQGTCPECGAKCKTVRGGDRDEYVKVVFV